MIPCVIHYCWFGRNPKPELATQCIDSWKKYCPDYNIIEWNEDNYDLSSAPLFVRQAYEARKWAFVTDYVRLDIVYKNGGIYFDTDVEVIRPIDSLLQYNAFFGTQDGVVISTGLGFGAEKGTLILLEMMEYYQSISFIKDDGTYDTTTCPERDTEVFVRHGLRGDNTLQVLPGNIVRLPAEYLSPKDYMTGKFKITEKTLTIHHFAESWMSEEQKIEMEKIKKELYHPRLSVRFKRWVVKLVGHEWIGSVRRLLRRDQHELY